MKAVIEIDLNDLNSGFLDMVRSMFQKNVTEIILKRGKIELQEFDKSLSIDEIKDSLEKSGYSKELISEIHDGLEDSSVYKK